MNIYNFLDADDCLVEDKFYYQIEDFNKNQNLALSLSNYDFVDINLIKIHESIFHRRLKPSSNILNDLLFRWERDSRYLFILHYFLKNVFMKV